eukprot:s602_g1.t1
MVLVDFAYHRWLEVFFPLAAPLSFVDDWQLVTCRAEFIEGAKQCLDRFLQAVDLQLDTRKTYTWSVSNTGRHQLQAAGNTVAQSGKNLGAHVQMSRRHTNAFQVARIQSLGAAWSKLRLSACSYPTKIRALRVAAWPKALHAIAATTLSDALFHSLRTSAMKGICADGAGCNAFVHMGLVEDSLTDPHFWAICNTFRFVRDCGLCRDVESTLVLLAYGQVNIPSNSITQTLLVRIQRLGWHVHETGQLQDVFGSFSLFDTSLSELLFRAAWAWQYYVAQQVSHRPGFVGLQYVDVPATRRWLAKLSLSDRLLMHKVLNGSHITEDCISHCHGGSDRCPFCDCVDSRFHRFWECTHFAEQRSGVPSDVWQLVPGLPEVTSSYGWAMRPSTLFQWYERLAQIPSPPVCPAFTWDQECHLFTDGSCLNQAWSSARVAAVVWASRSCDDQAQVLDAGPLPGIMQSSYRAEIFAVLRALEAAREVRGCLFLWSDCSGVVKRVRRMLKGFSPRANSAHSDLWMQVFCALQVFRPGQVQITEVRAHQTETDPSTFLETWSALNNAFADSAAKRAQWMRPASFWEFYKVHLNRLQASESVTHHVQRVILQVSRRAVQSRDEAAHEVDEVSVALNTRKPIVWGPFLDTDDFACYNCAFSRPPLAPPRRPSPSCGSESSPADRDGDTDSTASECSRQGSPGSEKRLRKKRKNINLRKMNEQIPVLV